MLNQHFVLFDGDERAGLLPFTYTRAIADIRCGILTIAQKWEKAYGSKGGIISFPYLQPKYTFNQKPDTIFINGALLPDKALADAIHQLKSGHSLMNGKGQILAVKPDKPISTLNHLLMTAKASKSITYQGNTDLLCNTWDIFLKNGAQIRADIAWMQLQPNADVIADSNHLKGHENIFVEEGATVAFSIINATGGPVYLGPHSEIMEGCIVRGPIALCEHAGLKMGAKVYGDSTIGPYSKIGGEVSNSVVLGYSNKGHDGFLGNSVLGEWCNLGADTNNSNLKNNYSSVKVWSYEASKEVDTGLQFCGLMMGDHSKCGINTMFNTGTVVGVSANIYGGDFPPKFIPSFSWGGAAGIEEYDLSKALDTAARVMARRNVALTETDKQILWQVFEDSSAFRSMAIDKKI